MRSEGRVQGLGAAIVVGVAFGAASLVMFALSYVLRGQGPSATTGVGALFAFGWAMGTIAAAIPLMLLLGRLRAGMVETRAGPVAQAGPTREGYGGFVGEGAQIRGGGVISTTSRAPAIFIGLSALLLAAAMLLMFGERSTSGPGAAAGGMIALVMLGWARAAWPRRKGEGQEAAGPSTP